MPRTVEAVLRELAEYNGEQGTCWDAKSNLKQLNRARDLIYSDPKDYVGTTEFACLEFNDCQCVYLPAHLSSIRRSWISTRPVVVRGVGYMSMDRIGLSDCCSCSPDCERAVQQTGNRRPVYNSANHPFSLQVTLEDISDDVQLRFETNKWDGGKMMIRMDTKDLPSGQGHVAERLMDITSATKPRTKGAILIEALLENGETVFLARYGADDINPRYTEYRVTNYINGDCDLNLVVLAKKEFRAYTTDDYDAVIDIESLPALRFAYQALNAQKGNRDAEYGSKMLLMSEHLDQSDINLSPSNGFSPAQAQYSTALDPASDLYC